MWLRWALSSWLRSEAQRRAQDAVGEALRGQTEASEAPPAEPQPADVGLVFALGIEAGGLVDLLEAVTVVRGNGFVARSGRLAERRVTIVECGPGVANARRGAAALLTGHHPRWVISAGLAGGLDDRLKQNDLFVATSITNLAGERLAVDVKLGPGPKLHVGRLLTVDHIVRTPAQRRELGQKHDALAVDMESFAVAELCHREKVRFLCIRVVSDTVDQELPADLEHLMKQTTRSGQAGAVVGSLFRRPGSIKDMWKLREDALLASDALAKFLAEILPQLPPHEASALEPPRDAD